MMSAKYFEYYTIILRGGRFFVDTLYNQLPSCYHSHKASYSNFSPKIGCHGNHRHYISTVFIGQIHPENPLKSNSVSLTIVQPKL